MQMIVDMPDNKIDLFLQVCRQNEGVLSASKRKKLFSMLSGEEAGRLERTVDSFFPSEDAGSFSGM